MKVLLIGSTGTIGKALSNALQAEGHDVVGVSRKSDPSVDISKTEDLKTFLTGMDPVDHIICTGGGAHIGATLDDITDEQIYEGINSKLMGQVNIVRFGYKKVNKGGSILLTGGIFGFKPVFPNCSQVAMVNAGLHGFAINAASDLKVTGVGINTIHPPLLKETADMFGMPSDGMATAADTANAYVACLGKGGTGQRYFVPGFGLDD